MGLAAAASWALLVLQPLRAPTSGLPAPERSLLELQLKAASGDPESAANLDERMHDYRGRLLASLRERYHR
jgi:hypothetical protein